MLSELLTLFFTFFKIGSITFGGGLAMLPILERELIQKKSWTTSEELLDYYAISQSTPGIIAVNVSTFIGHKRKGIIGAFFATLGMVTPSLIIITLIATFISNFESIEWIQKAMHGINISVSAMLTYAAVNLARKNLKNIYGVIFYIAGFTAVYFFHIHSIFVILSAAAIGVAMFFISTKTRRNK